MQKRMECIALNRLNPYRKIWIETDYTSDEKRILCQYNKHFLTSYP